MRTKRLFIGDKLIPCSSLSYRLGVNLNALDDFSAVVPRHLTEIEKGQQAKIYWGKKLDFKGYYEEREVTRDETGVSHIITGRSVGVLANRRSTQRELFLQKDPSEILTLLNQPTGEPFDPSNIVCVTITPFHDSYVYSAEPTTNYGDEINTSVGLVVDSAVAKWARALYEATMPSDLYTVEYGSAEVLSGKLSLYCFMCYVDDPNFHRGNISIHRNTSGWDEDTVTWTTKPGHEADETSDIGQPTSEGWYEFDVKADIQEWADHPADNDGWTVRDHDEYSGAEDARAIMYFVALNDNSQAQLWPELKLIYRVNRDPFADVAASHNPDDAAYAIDHFSDTGWNSGDTQEADMYWRYDLGAVRSICRIDIVQDPSLYARNWVVEISENGIDWTEVDSGTSSTSSVIAVAFEAANAQYVQIRLTDIYPAQWEIQDVTVYTAGDNPIFEEGKIQNYGLDVDMRFDFTKRDGGMAEVGNDVGWDAYVTFNEEKNFLNLGVRGRDLSSSIRFVEGINLTTMSFKDSIVPKVNRLRVLGQGEGGEQLRVLKEDLADIELNGAFEYVHEEKTIIDSVVMEAFATDLFNKLLEPTISLRGIVHEPPSSEMVLTTDVDFDAGTFVDTSREEVGVPAYVKLYGGLIDSFDSEGPLVAMGYGSSVGCGVGQAITVVNTFTLSELKVQVTKSGAGDDFEIVAKVYAASGTVGIDAVATGAPIATSTNTIASAEISHLLPTPVTFTFADELTPDDYVIAILLSARTSGSFVVTCGQLAFATHYGNAMSLWEDGGVIASADPWPEVDLEFEIWAGAGEFPSDGTWTSAAQDTLQSAPTYGLLSWNATIPEDTVVKLQFKAASSVENLASAEFEGPTGMTDYFLLASGEDIPAKWQGLQYFQVKAYLSTTGTETPYLNDITIGISTNLAPGDWAYLKNSDLDVDGTYRIYLIERNDGGFATMTFGNKSEDLTSLIRSTLMRNIKVWARSKQNIEARTEIEP